MELSFSTQKILRAYRILIVENCILFTSEYLWCGWQVKATHLADQCTCAGAFKNTDSPADFEKRLRVFLNIAKYHGFQLLEEIVTWLLTTPAQNAPCWVFLKWSTQFRSLFNTLIMSNEPFLDLFVVQVWHIHCAQKTTQASAVDALRKPL